MSSFSVKEALAYSFNNWGGTISTVTYILTYLAFLSIIYSRVRLIAGYNFGEILLLSLLGQINFYLLWVWSTPSINRLTESVKKGELDLVLSRPVPLLWFVSIRRIRLTFFIFEGIPALIPPAIITWQNFHSPITLPGLFIGMILIICGQLLIHCLQFIAACLVFWSGEGGSVGKLVEGIRDFGETVPFEGYPLSLRLLFSVILPVLIASSLSTSFILGKNTAYWLVIPVIFLTALFAYIKVRVWRAALANYSSASS